VRWDDRGKIRGAGRARIKMIMLGVEVIVLLLGGGS
jgi:hypothetical protein